MFQSVLHTFAINVSTKLEMTKWRKSARNQWYTKHSVFWSAQMTCRGKLSVVARHYAIIIRICSCRPLTSFIGLF